MIEGLKPYAEYKESDIPWAPVIPSSWRTERAKRLFTKMQRPVRPEDDVVTCFRDGMVTLRKNRRLRGFTEATVYSGYQGIRKGDLVIHGMDAFAGAIGVSDSDGKGTPVYNVCQPRLGVVASYYAHTVREMSRAQWILALAKGIRERSTDFRYEMFGNQFVPLPPPEEQAAIVRFLDHANRKIDGFIRAKRKLIGLLNEQKQAIIHRAVTGKDEVRMVKDKNGNSSFILQPSTLAKKPSGIPWLGDIPKHWDTPLLGRRLNRIEQGWSPVGAEGQLGERQWCVLTLSAVRRGVFNPEAIKPVSTSADIPLDIEVANGDLLLTRSNTRDRVGDVCLVKDVRHRTLLCDLIYRLTLRKGAFVPQFLVYQLLCPLGRGQIEKDARGSSGTMPKISQSHIKAWRVLLPPTEEQQAIVEFIEIESKPIDTAITRTEREIALMQEYRTRLTADVVTGKLDVREAAARLPEPEGDHPYPNEVDLTSGLREDAEADHSADGED